MRLICPRFLMLRYCGFPVRDANLDLLRRPTVAGCRGGYGAD